MSNHDSDDTKAWPENYPVPIWDLADMLSGAKKERETRGMNTVGTQDMRHVLARLFWNAFQAFLLAPAIVELLREKLGLKGSTDPGPAPHPTSGAPVPYPMPDELRRKPGASRHDTGDEQSPAVRTSIRMSDDPLDPKRRLRLVQEHGEALIYDELLTSASETAQVTAKVGRVHLSPGEVDWLIAELLKTRTLRTDPAEDRSCAGVPTAGTSLAYRATETGLSAAGVLGAKEGAGR